MPPGWLWWAGLPARRTATLRTAGVRRSTPRGDVRGDPGFTPVISPRATATRTPSATESGGAGGPPRLLRDPPPPLRNPLMSSLGQAMLINALVLFAVLEADLGPHRKVGAFRVLRPAADGGRHDRAALRQGPGHPRHRARPRSHRGRPRRPVRAGRGPPHHRLPQPAHRAPGQPRGLRLRGPVDRGHRRPGGLLLRRRALVLRRSSATGCCGIRSPGTPSPTP